MKLIYFTAPWCTPCKRFLPIVNSVSEKLNLNLVVCDVSIDTKQANSYGVKSVPTLYVFDCETDLKLYEVRSVVPESELENALKKLATDNNYVWV